MNKALFLDRDGIVNKDKNYIYRINDFEFNNEIFDVCRYFQSQGYLIFIITNQAGIARGYYSEKDFLRLTRWMLLEFKAKGIEITKVYYCPHHPNFATNCSCRKPEPGMILKAQQEYDLDLSNSILLGDKNIDILVPC